MKEETGNKNRSLKKAFLFISIVVLLIVLSLVFRIIALIKDSSYSGDNRFNIAIIINKNNATLLSYDPINETLNEVKITNDRKKLSPGRILGVPVDGVIELNEENEQNLKTPSDYLRYSMVHPGTKISRLNYYDLIRLYLFSRFTALGNYSSETFSATDVEINLDKAAQRYFIDERILEEQLSIEIVNGTLIQGLGKRLERIIRNAGGNVVSVTNSQDVVNTSVIQSSVGKTYTQNKLEILLNYPAQNTNRQSIADLRIIIGQDGLREEIF